MNVDGVLNLIKPPGMTSHDAVAAVRRALGVRKVGHTGTLDPGVAGVLPICIGRATRLAEFIAGEEKAYRAEITLGIVTDTQDSFGQVLSEQDASHIGKGDFAYMLTRFHGEVWQTPPMVSAVKVGGERLYDLHRRGIEVERAARPVTMHALRLLRFEPGAHPVALIDVTCSKGTYIRTLAHDIGAKLGVGGHLSYLVRTRSGPFALEGAATMEELNQGRAPLLAPAAALGRMERLSLTPDETLRVGHGVGPERLVDLAGGTLVALLDPTGDLVALAEVRQGALKLRKVFR